MVFSMSAAMPVSWAVATSEEVTISAVMAVVGFMVNAEMLRWDGLGGSDGLDGSGLLGGGGEFAGVELGLEVIALDGPGGDEGGGVGASFGGGSEVFFFLPVFEVSNGFVEAGGDVCFAGFGLFDGAGAVVLFGCEFALLDGDGEDALAAAHGDGQAMGGDALWGGAHVFFREGDDVSVFESFDE